MSRSTRRRMVCFLVLGLFAVPAEIFVLNGLARVGTPTPELWVESLTLAQREQAAASIAKYPLEYRRVLLREVSAAVNAQVWRSAIDQVLRERITLGAPTRQRLFELRGHATETTFAQKTLPSRVITLAKTLESELNRADYRSIFVTAGPEPGGEATAALPIQIRLHSYLRGRAVALATLDCNCYTHHAGECNPEQICSELHGCEFSYFGCGIWYLEPCNGYCHAPLLF